ncbi:GlxA family transcriptional regulator [Flagellimonas okinawensis]|uniref:DJ-1/PfpI family protein n=1 Tax=Flagellimonas okinawensis TaxID=3031324 RepID=A0ABT5XRN7_9FLAO|nr:DJ-1/PfpI family protein [[Muricauda] okinawensis]MDF0708251.1 DJ-1/PfpI family protein [[Muricauda] okinawensis]
MSTNTKKLVFICFSQTHLLDMAGPAHVFYEAVEYGADYELLFVTTDKSEVLSTSGLYFSKLVHFQELELNKEDIVFLPGLDFSLLSNQEYINQLSDFFYWLKVQHHKGIWLASVCTGAFILAETGLLDGKSCTTHWRRFASFEERFPMVSLLKNRLFVEDQFIFSSAGISSGIDLSLFLIEKQYGSRFAMEVAREVLVYLRRSGTDPQLSLFLQHRNHLDDRVHKIQDFITKNFHQKLTIDSMSEMVYTSPRNLTRMFKKATGITIGNYIDKIRMEHAQQLIREKYKMDCVAEACGFKSTGQLFKLLKKMDTHANNVLNG